MTIFRYSLVILVVLIAAYGCWRAFRPQTELEAMIAGNDEAVEKLKRYVAERRGNEPALVQEMVDAGFAYQGTEPDGCRYYRYQRNDVVWFTIAIVSLCPDKSDATIALTGL